MVSSASKAVSLLGESSAQAPCLSSTRTVRSTSIVLRAAYCSTVPAQSIRKRKGVAEPSRMGNLGAVQLHHGVINAGGGQRRHHMLNGADPRFGVAGQADLRAEARFAHEVMPRGNVEAEVAAMKNDARAERARMQGQEMVRPLCRPMPRQPMLLARRRRRPSEEPNEPEPSVNGAKPSMC